MQRPSSKRDSVEWHRKRHSELLRILVKYELGQTFTLPEPAKAMQFGRLDLDLEENQSGDAVEFEKSGL